MKREARAIAMSKKCLVITVLAVLSVSCTKGISVEDPVIQDERRKVEIDIASFSSRQELLKTIEILGDTKTKSDEEDMGPKYDLFTDLEDLDYENDPILSIEYQIIDGTHLIPDEDTSVYEALGYDELIPNMAFAKLLNARAEIMVQDTVYKVSHRGTYFYPAAYRDEFEENYANFELSEGTPVSDNVYQMSSHVFRYSTFDGDAYEEVEIEEGDEEVEEEITKAPTVKWGNTINWKQYPRENVSASTWLGKKIESIIGRNKAYTYNYNKRARFNAKFYHYNYLVYSEIGILSQVQSKPLLFWRDAAASKICAGWNNIVYEMKIPSVNPLGMGSVSPSQRYIASTSERIPWTGEYGKSVYVFDKQIPVSRIYALAGQGVTAFLNGVKSMIKEDVSDAKIIKFFVDSKVVVVIVEGYEEKTNSARIHKVFHKSLAIGVDKIDLFNLPSSWQQWAVKVVSGTYNLPRFELKSGEVRTAAQYNGQVKAVSLYKPNN